MESMCHAIFAHYLFQRNGLFASSLELLIGNFGKTGIPDIFTAALQRLLDIETFRLLRGFGQRCQPLSKLIRQCHSDSGHD